MKHTASRKQALRRLATAGLLTATAMILSWIEFILPFSIGVPGVKLGLCHIVTLFALYRLTAWETVAVTAVRITLTAALFGSVASLVYSAVGGFFSVAVMLLLHRLRWRERPLFSPMGISIAGAVTHNLGQVAAAAVLMQTAGVLTYFSVLLVTGVLTGAVIGLVSGMVQQRLAK